MCTLYFSDGNYCDFHSCTKAFFLAKRLNIHKKQKNCPVYVWIYLKKPKY